MKTGTKFKAGDKVRRIVRDFYHTRVGEIYTVKHVRGTSIELKEVDGSYELKYFTLVTPTKIEQISDIVKVINDELNGEI